MASLAQGRAPADRGDATAGRGGTPAPRSEKQRAERERRITEDLLSLSTRSRKRTHRPMCDRKKRRTRRARRRSQVGSKPEPPDSLPEISETPTPYLAGNGPTPDTDPAEEGEETSGDEPDE